MAITKPSWCDHVVASLVQPQIEETGKAELRAAVARYSLLAVHHVAAQTALT